jgi:hypothetical protein
LKVTGLSAAHALHEMSAHAITIARTAQVPSMPIDFIVWLPQSLKVGLNGTAVIMPREHDRGRRAGKPLQLL